MSLRDSYFNGPSGLQQQMDGAFQAGIAFVGTGVSDISTLDLAGRNGTSLAAGAANPGYYFTYASPQVIYAMWLYVSGEIAPTVANATLIQVVILAADTATIIASKIAAVMNAIGGTPFAVTSSADVVTMANNVAGAAVTPISDGTLGGSTAVAQVQAGSMPTGNFGSLQSALIAAAAQGLLHFRVVIQGTGTANASYLRSRNGDNLYLSSFFAGVEYALASEDIYNYQVSLELDISTNSATNVIFHFNFGGGRKHDERPRVRLEPLKGPNIPGIYGVSVYY